MDVTWDTIVIFGYHCFMDGFFPHLMDDMDCFPSKINGPLALLGIWCEAVCLKVRKVPTVFFVLWVSMWKFPSGYLGLPQIIQTQKRPVQYVLYNPHDSTGDSISGSFLTIRLANWIFVVTLKWWNPSDSPYPIFCWMIKELERLIPVDALFQQWKPWLFWLHSLTMLIVYYQYRMSCPTEYTSKYAILSTVCQ